jgi:phosphoribosylformylglycinamidine synthase
VTIAVRSLDDAALQATLKGLGLTLKLTEARRVAELLGRDPTETELTLFDTMWSEHCSYKSSRAVLKRHLPTEASNVILGPSEDAGIVELAVVDGVRWGLAVGHESHNHPSQVMPVEGAATGIGGVVRDVYCMGADVIATLDPLRFGDPFGPSGERCREIAREVVQGIALYGNALGVPNLGGDVLFDGCYDDNCLVNVVAIGLVRADRIIRSRVPEQARREPYDFLLVGKPTDWSGMGGAAFASADLDEAALAENQGSVQVPDPFLKRVLVLANQAMLDLARNEGAPIGFKDLGAGGIACVSSELADAAGLGIELDLADASLAEEDLPDRVAACSETQERFGIACPSRITEKILRIYNEDYDLPSMYPGAGARRVGRILVPEAGEPARYLLRRGEEVLVDAPIATITEGIRYAREARSAAASTPAAPLDAADRDPAGDLVALMGTVHLASRRPLFQHFDSEVKGDTVLRPGEADAGVVAPIPGSRVGMAASVDGNPRYCRVDPYLGAVHAVVEAARNVVCVGASPAAVTDCLNYGNPEVPEVFHAFVEGVRGIGDACRGLGRLEAPGEALPVISGNVSFYNQSARGRAVAPSPILCCVGTVPDVGFCRSLSFKEAGHLLYRVGRFASELGGSLYAQHVDPRWSGPLPAVDFAALRGEMAVVLDLIRAGAIVACHDVSEGGTLAALAEMALGPESRGRWGCRVDLAAATAAVGATAAAFGEAGAFLVEVGVEDGPRLEEGIAAAGGWCVRLGEVTDSPTLAVEGLGRPCTVELALLAAAREHPLFDLLSREEA